MKRVINYFLARKARFYRFFIIQNINYARKERGYEKLIPEVEAKYNYPVDSIGTALVISEIAYQRESRKLESSGYYSLANV